MFNGMFWSSRLHPSYLYLIVTSFFSLEKETISLLLSPLLIYKFIYNSNIRVSILPFLQEQMTGKKGDTWIPYTSSNFNVVSTLSIGRNVTSQMFHIPLIPDWKHSVSFLWLRHYHFPNSLSCPVWWLNLRCLKIPVIICVHTLYENVTSRKVHVFTSSVHRPKWYLHLSVPPKSPHSQIPKTSRSLSSSK